jgi:hypothetical protein
MIINAEDRATQKPGTLERSPYKGFLSQINQAVEAVVVSTGSKAVSLRCRKAGPDLSSQGSWTPFLSLYIAYDERPP